MSKSSEALAAQLSRNDLALKGATKYAKDLGDKAPPIAASLSKRAPKIQQHNAAQEAARAALNKATADLKAEVKAAAKERQQLIGLAEVVFGKRGPELQEFRSKVDDKV